MSISTKAYSMEEKIEEIKSSLPASTRLVAVSKFHPTEAIVEAYEAGQRIFGESRVQELLAKYEELSGAYLDLSWHFIGPLQSNKVKYIAPFIDLIHSVSSVKLLDTINKQGEKNKRVIPILLEVHIAQEDSKSGFAKNELIEVLQLMKDEPERFAHIKLSGLMTIATNTDDTTLLHSEFAYMDALFREIKESDLLVDKQAFTELSMGMSGDYKIAVEHNATLVRVGSAIFGERSYN